MSKFRIHRSFEDELAGKADEFSMKPSPRAWEGIDAGLSAHARVAARTKKLVFLGSAVIFTTLFTLYTLNITRTDPVVDKTPSSLTPSHSSPSQRNAAIEKLRPSRSERKNPETPFFSNQEQGIFQSADNEPQQPYDAPNFYYDNSIVHVEEASAPMRSMNAIAPKDLSVAAPLVSNKPESLKKTPPRNFRDGWNIALSYAPLHSFRELNAKTEFARPVTDYRNKTDKPLPGATARIAARYYVLERVSVAFGLAYGFMGESISIAPPKESKFYNSIAKDNGYEEKERLYSMGDNYRHNNYYHQLELPVMLYISKPFTPRLSVTTGVGASLSYTFSKEFLVYDYRIDHYALNSEFLRKWNSTFNAQVLMEYRANSRLLFSAGPEFRYSILSTYRDNYSIGQHQYALGLNLGAQWKLFSY